MLRLRLLTAASIIVLIFISSSRVRATGFSVSSPPENSNILGNIVTVKFTLPENFRFSTSPNHTRPIYGQGHIHLWLDTENYSPSSAIHVNSDTYVFENVKSGPHILTAEWVTNNDVPSKPPLISSVSFNTTPILSQPKNFTVRYLVKMFSLISILAIAALYLISNYPPIKPNSKSTKKNSKK